MVAEELYEKRGEIPVLKATTLLVHGYVDAEEVEAISRFIAELDPEIPYSLLVFHPSFMINDLPITPERKAVDCYKAAKKHLRRVHIGNLYLLGIGCAANLDTIC